MDANEQPETVSRAPWMAADEVWLTVPSSGKLLAFNEASEFAHSLSGVRVPVYMISDRFSGQFEICTRTEVVERWQPRIADNAARGSELYDVLMRAGFPLWTPEPHTVAQWFEHRVVLDDDDDGFSVIERGELEERLMDARDAQYARNRQRRVAERTAAAERRAAREAMAERDAEWRARPDYEALFEQVYGKA